MMVATGGGNKGHKATRADDGRLRENSSRVRAQRDWDHGSHWIRRQKSGALTVYRVRAGGELEVIASARKIEDAEKIIAIDRTARAKAQRGPVGEDEAQDNAIRGEMSHRFMFPRGGWGAW